MTPMFKQYLGAKAEYPDAILFFRMGDFYEMFFEDAKTASRVLGITLTARGSLNGEKVPMCGVPHHSAGAYIRKLIGSGLKVAVCEQVEEPGKGGGIVKREVVRVVTPGSALTEGEEEEKRNVYIGAVSAGAGNYGLAHADLSTGEFRVTEIEGRRELLDELGRIDPVELLVPAKGSAAQAWGLSPYRLELVEPLDEAQGEHLLKEQLGVRSLAGFGCGGLVQGVTAAAMIVRYLQDTQKGRLDHIREIVPYRLGEYMFLDESTTWNLELFRTMRRQSVQGSLFHVLDRTVTPMGGRRLRKWIGYPLLDLDLIHRRLAAVSWFREDPLLREELRSLLEGIYDLERLNGRIALGRANARDLAALRTSVEKLPSLKGMLAHTACPLLEEAAEGLDTLEDVGVLIARAIRDDPPVSLKEGGIIREGYHEGLDRLIAVSRGGKTWINELAATEQKRTGISSLKVGYNKVFGYYIEVSKANLHLVPPDYTRKQTLVNGERYITEALKKYEESVLGAEEKRVALEYALFEEIRTRLARENQRIMATAGLIGDIDALLGLAETAALNHYICPEVNDGGVIEILDGRHPVVERTVKDEEFVPNDVHLDDREQQLLILTGPNMAGKSTVLRQTALIVLMAQMGGFVPASKAVIGRVDRIFTRIGASDDLARGQSTFMVEMNETANILRHVTPESLVILDEIGRGTSTYDGLSIAWAVAEALHDKGGKGVKTLFATHYHELTEMTSAKPRVKNFNMAVKDWRDQIIFLRKMVPGATSRSYGIEVARIAGLPETVVARAREILGNLEGGELDEAGRPKLAHSSRGKPGGDPLQLSLFGGGDPRLREWLRGLDIAAMTPLEALVELNRIKEYVECGDLKGPP